MRKIYPPILETYYSFDLPNIEIPLSNLQQDLRQKLDPTTMFFKTKGEYQGQISDIIKDDDTLLFKLTALDIKSVMINPLNPDQQLVPFTTMVQITFNHQFKKLVVYCYRSVQLSGVIEFSDSEITKRMQANISEEPIQLPLAWQNQLELGSNLLLSIRPEMNAICNAIDEKIITNEIQIHHIFSNAKFQLSIGSLQSSETSYGLFNFLGASPKFIGQFYQQRYLDDKRARLYNSNHNEGIYYFRKVDETAMPNEYDFWKVQSVPLATQIAEQSADEIADYERRNVQFHEMGRGYVAIYNAHRDLRSWAHYYYFLYLFQRITMSARQQGLPKPQ